MIPFFNEMKDPKNVSVILEERFPASKVKLYYLSRDLSFRCAKLIGELERLNPLHLTKDEENMEFTNFWVDFDKRETANTLLNNYDVEQPLDYYHGKGSLFSALKKGINKYNELGITNNGFNKMMELLVEYIPLHKDDDLEFKCDIKDLAMSLGDYIWENRAMEYSKKGIMNYSYRDFIMAKNYLAVDFDDKIMEYLYEIEQFFKVRNRVLSSKYTIFDYIELASKILKRQNRLPEELEKECKECLEAIENFEICIPAKRILEDVKISNSFYITPNRHLFHATDHKNNDILFEFIKIMEAMNPSLGMLDPKGYFYKARKYKENGYLTMSEIKHYYNFDKKCFFIKNDNYDSLDWKMKSDIDDVEGKCYDKTLLELAIGIESAYGYLYEFFYNLKLNANFYEMEVNKIGDMTFKDFMVRCCGFHKIETKRDKLITTSCVNWEEEFSEYIKRGWTIEFIPPIVLNDGTLEEYNKDFLTMRRVLKSNRFDRNC